MYYKNTNVKYRTVFFTSKLKYNKLNKLSLKKYINYLFFKKKIDIIILFKDTKFSQLFKLAQFEYKILNLNIINLKLIYFFLYLMHV